MKKVFTAILTATVLSVTLLSGCGSSAEEGTEAAVQTAEAETTDQPQIGIVFYSNTDELGKSVETLCNQAASVWGIPDIRWEIGQVSADGQIDQIQNLISAGVNGIMIIPMTDAVAQKCSQLCEDAGVYFSICFRTISDEAIRQEVESNPFFAGMVNEAESEAGEYLVDALTEAGRTKLGVVYAQTSTAVGLQRNEGIDKAIEENGCDMLAHSIIPGGGDVMTLASNVQNYLTSFPDINGIVAGAGSSGNGETIAQTIVSSGKDVKMACFDTFTGTEEYFEQGILVAAAGGTAPDALYSLSLLYNACIGNPVSEGPCELKQPFLFVESLDDFGLFSQYVVDPQGLLSLYTDDHIQSLVKTSNSELTVESMQEMMNEYNFDWIKEKVE